MIKKYFNNTGKVKNLFLVSLVAGAAAMAMSFGPMFFGPGLTDVTPVAPFFNGNFTDQNVTVDPYEVAFPNLTFNDPLTFTVVPFQDKIVIGQMDGEVFWIDDDNATAVKNPLIDLSDEVGVVWDGGFLGLSIHPQFGTLGKNYFYVYYTTKSNDDSLELGHIPFLCGVELFADNYLLLERFEVDPISLLPVPGTRETMIKRRMYNTTHRGGGMEFGDDGFLYLSTGDQATLVSAQQLDENLDGGVLRLDVDMIGGAISHAPIRVMPDDAGEADEFTGVGYFIPNDNPWESPGGDTFEEYYTIGHRNPHRMTKDSQTGIFYMGEVGEITHEEINVISKGSNYGWPLFEASIPGPQNQCGLTGLLDGMPNQLPLVEFPRADAGSIIGGYVYRGTEAPDFIGNYISADWLTRQIFSVDIGTGIYDNLGALPRRPISFGQDQQGELYYLTGGQNVQLLRFVQPGAVTGVPQTLSATNAFADLESLTVSDGFIPYDMIDPFWSDGAYKKRWMSIPNDGTHDTAQEQIQFSENGVWEFPIGTVIIKHFDYPVDDRDPDITKKIETRFSIKNTNGNWSFLTYNWNDDETEAFLQETGLDEPMTITTVGGGTRPIEWHFPSTTECLSCHNEVSQGTLGPRTRYLNSDYDYSTHTPSGTVGNQLVTLSALGILDEDITDTDTPGYLTHTSINDINGSLDDKARSYLDVNCAYCHQPGDGGRADFDLRLSQSLIETGLLTARMNNVLPGLPGDQRILYPGNADKSQLFHRTNDVTPGVMMPPVAKGQVDNAGVLLLQQWINQLQVPPTPIANSDVTLGSGPLTVQFTGSDSFDDIGIASYAWDFGDGGTSTVADPSYEYATPGRYTATLTVTDDDAQMEEATIAIFVTGGAVDNVANPDVNLALLPDVQLGGSVINGRGTPEAILYDPAANNYATPTAFNEYGVTFGVNLGQPDVDNGFRWQADWISRKQINYITFGGVFPNQPQPNSLWRVSYRVGTAWTILEEGIGGWINAGIYEWGGMAQAPIEADALRVQVYSDGTNDLLNIHLRGRGGISTGINDSATATKATLIQYLSDDGSPVANFDFTVNNLEVTFDGSTSTDNVGVVSYAWDFGDTNVATDTAPVHTYAEAGTYTVTLTVTDADGLTDTNTQDITVTENPSVPVALINTDVTSGAAPLPVSFTGSGSTDDVGVVSYAWDFGDGTTSTEANPIYVYNTPGNYTASLIVTDGDNQTDTTSIGIIASGGMVDNTPNTGLNLALSPDALISGSTTNGRGTPQAILYDPSIDNYFVPTDFNQYGVTFGENLGRPNADNGFRWQVDWAASKEVNYVTFGGVFPNQPQPNTQWRVSYRVGNDWTVLEEGAGGWINAGIYEWGGPTELPIQMDGLRVQLFSDGTNDLVSIHLRGRGGVSNSLDDSATLVKATLIQYLPDTGAPISDFDHVAADLEVSFDSSASTDDIGIISYNWDFGDGNGSTMENPVHTYAAEGTYTVTLTVTDGDGSSDVTAKDITVTGDNTVPVAIASSDVSIGPAPLAVQFTGSGSTDDVGIVSYAWDFGNGVTAVVADPNYSYLVPGNYTATLTVTDGDGRTTSDTLTILATGGAVDNNPNAGLNLALLPDAVLSGSTADGRGIPQAILYDPSKDDYFVRTDFNQYGVGFGQNLGRPDADNGFRWQVDWAARKEVNYITFGGVFDNQPQPNSLWRISYRVGNTWTLLEEGAGGWIDSGIYEWGGVTETPIEMDGLRAQIYSDGTNDLISIHLRGRGGVSSSIDDSATATKATLIQFLPGAGAPVSDFDVTITDLEVDFDSSASTDNIAITSYNWDFGDGNSSTEASPTYTYSAGGMYTVSLTVTDDDDLSDTSSRVITLGDPENQAPVAVITTSLITGEAPLNEVFTGSGSTDDVGIVSYEWDFGDGNTSTDPDPTYVYTTPGTYTATLTVTDAEGLSDEATVIIVVTNTVANNAPNAGLNLALLPDATLSGSPNNTRGTPQAILYDPARNDYFVRTDYNEYGVPFGVNLGLPDVDNGFRWQVDWASRKQVNYITIGGAFANQPQPNSLWRVSYRVGNVWTMLEEGTGGWIDNGIYEWGSPIEPVIDMDGLRVQVYSDGVNEVISIHLRGRGGRSNLEDDRATTTKATLIQYLPDAGAPESNFVFTDNELQVDFDSSSSLDDIGITGYAWDFGDGMTSTEANPTYIYFESGTYEVSLTVTDGDGKEDTSIQTITVAGNGIPVAVATSDVASGAAPLTVSFVGSASRDDAGVVSYAWDFGDGGTATDADPMYVFNTVGVYDVGLTVADAEGLTNSTSLTITVTVPNLAPVAVASSNIATGEAPLSVSFVGSNSTDDTGVVSYAWDFGDGGTSTDADPTHVFNTVGVYDVDLTVTDAEGLADTISVTITVAEGNMPPVAVASSDITTGEAPLTVSFTGSTSTDDTGVVSYAWDFGDGGTATDANTIYVFNTEGTYEVSLTVTDAEGLVDSTTITITVGSTNMPPVAVASSDITTGEAPLTVSFIGSTSTDDTGVVSYAWDFGDGGTATDADPTYVFNTVGVYDATLTVTDAEGLISTASVSITVEGSTEELELILAPNPAIEFVEIILNGLVSEDDIIGFMLHDSAGRLIRQFRPEELAKNVNGNFEISLEILMNETYVVTVMLNNEEPIAKRLILRR